MRFFKTKNVNFQLTDNHGSDAVDSIDDVIKHDPDFQKFEEGGEFLKDPRIVKILLEEFSKFN